MEDNAKYKVSKTCFVLLPSYSNEQGILTGRILQ